MVLKKKMPNKGFNSVFSLMPLFTLATLHVMTACIFPDLFVMRGMRGREHIWAHTSARGRDTFMTGLTR